MQNTCRCISYLVNSYQHNFLNIESCLINYLNEFVNKKNLKGRTSLNSIECVSSVIEANLYSSIAPLIPCCSHHTRHAFHFGFHCDTVCSRATHFNVIDYIANCCCHHTKPTPQSIHSSAIRLQCCFKKLTFKLFLFPTIFTCFGVNWFLI